MYSTVQKMAAEFMGTFTLCFIGIGAICAGQFLKGGNPDAGGLGLAGIALAHGLAMANMVCALGHISGAHFNPAITIGFWVTKRMGTLETGLYWISQLAGAVAASFLLKVVVPEDVWRAVNLGTPAPATGFTVASGMILEAVLTFFLVWVVFATAVDERSSFRGVAGYAIGLTVCMGVLAGGPFTGAALNPARAFGPALATGYMTNHGMYWVGPLFGGAVAAALYNSLLMKPKAGGN